MFNIGPAELLVIGLVLLIAVGPEQLPGVIRRVGSTVAQVRSMTDGLRTEFMAGLEEIERATDIEKWSAEDEDSRSDGDSTQHWASSSTAAPSPAPPSTNGATDGPTDGTDDADDEDPAVESEADGEESTS